MKQRGITLDNIRDVLTAYDITRLPGGNAKVCYIGHTVDGRKLKVCVDKYIEDLPPDDGQLIIVTTHWC